jgi:hypothetical protein
MNYNCLYSLTRGSRSVGIVLLRATTTEFSFFLTVCSIYCATLVLQASTNALALGTMNEVNMGYRHSLLLDILER